MPGVSAKVRLHLPGSVAGRGPYLGRNPSFTPHLRWELGLIPQLFWLDFLICKITIVKLDLRFSSPCPSRVREGILSLGQSKVVGIIQKKNQTKIVLLVPCKTISLSTEKLARGWLRAREAAGENALL